MKKSYIAPLVEEITMTPTGVLMGSNLPPDPHSSAPRRRSRYVE